MPCYHPLVAWRGPLLPSGKRAVVFKASESTGGLSAFPLRLPCGQCVGCRLDHSLDWAVRCMNEAQLHSDNCFITLTYDDVHLPDRRSLDHRDFQLFMKKLRRKFSGQKIKYLQCGEYGEECYFCGLNRRDCGDRGQFQEGSHSFKSVIGRPHFHALLFGVDFSDRVPVGKSPSGFTFDGSACLSELWKKGFVSVGPVTFESAAYVARYSMKKVTGRHKEEVDDITGLRHYERVDSETGEVSEVVPEYITMSRGGRTGKGLAQAWYDRFKSDVYPHDYVVVKGGIKRPPPRYYDDKYELENPVDMKRIKMLRCSRNGGREVVRNDVLNKNQLLDKNRPDRLAVMEECKLSAIRTLKRRVDNE